LLSFDEQVVNVLLSPDPDKSLCLFSITIKAIMLLMTKILVVEDEPALQETLSYSLTRQGYTVNVAGDGNSAQERSGSCPQIPA
jgi:PleD family two-component response regulator